MKTLFIDTYYSTKDEKERARFTKYTDSLWKFATSVEPFYCKDIEIALNEIKNLTSINKDLKLNRTDLEKSYKTLINEKINRFNEEKQNLTMELNATKKNLENMEEILDTIRNKFVAHSVLEEEKGNLTIHLYVANENERKVEKCKHI